MKLSGLCCFLLVGTTAVCASAYKKEPNFLNARRNGGLARIELRVVDDESNPVAEAKVRVFMGMNFRERGYWLEGTTDTNGVFMIDGKTTGNEIEINLSKVGYYDSKKKLCFIKMGTEHEVLDGKWQPWGAEEKIVLRQIKDPINMTREDFYLFRKTKAIKTWIGYDIKCNDYVAPYGKGEYCDFEVFIDWNGQWLPNYSGMWVKIRFREPYSGFYSCPIAKQSEFKWPYKASVIAKYLQEASFGEIVLPNGAREEHLFDMSKCWVVRSRCKVDDTGKLVAANYSIVSGIGISCKKDGVGCFCIIGAFNTTPNDTNLEDDALYQRYKRLRDRR